MLVDSSVVKENVLIHTRDSVMFEMLQTNFAGVWLMVLVALCGSSARCCSRRWGMGRLRSVDQ